MGMGLKKRSIKAMATSLMAVFLGVSGLQAQNDNAVPVDSLQNDTTEMTLKKRFSRALNDTERQSRQSFKGRSPHRPYHVSYVGVVGADTALIGENEQTLVHMASISKVPAAMTFYYTRDRALEEAGSEEEREDIRQMFAEIEPLISTMIVYSDNVDANRVAAFLDGLDFKFIEDAKKEQGVSSGRLRVFSQVLVPMMLATIGEGEYDGPVIIDTQMKSASGLPSYEFAFNSNRYEYPDRNTWPEGAKSRRSNAYYDWQDYNVSTPYEIFKILEHMVEHYPQIHKIMGQPVLVEEVKDGVLWRSHNTNPLLENSVRGRVVNTQGVDGGKTGTTQGSGKSIVVTAERDGVRIIAVHMGGYSYPERDYHTQELVEEAFEMLAPKMAENRRLDSLAQVARKAFLADSLAVLERQRAADSIAYRQSVIAAYKAEQEKADSILTLSMIDQKILEIDSTFAALDSVLTELRKQKLDDPYQIRKRERLMRLFDKRKEVLLHMRDSLRVEGVKEDEAIIFQDNPPKLEN